MNLVDELTPEEIDWYRSEREASIIRRNNLIKPYGVKNPVTLAEVYKERGGKIEIELTDFRTEFRRDYNKVAHSTRYLVMHDKTQVVPGNGNKGLKNRLSHTIQVESMGASIGETLGLNQDLILALAANHDRTHGPFGHICEKGFEAFAEEELSKGISIVYEHNDHLTRDELLTGVKLLPIIEFNSQKHTNQVHGEGKVVDEADEISYLGDDPVDALRLICLKTGKAFLTMDMMKELTIMQEIDATQHKLESAIKKFYQAQLCHQSLQNINKLNIETVEQLQKLSHKTIVYPAKVAQIKEEHKAFMFQYYYHHPEIKQAKDWAKEIIIKLCKHFNEHPNEVVKELREKDPKAHPKQAVIDYVSTFTDQEAIERGKQINCDEAKQLAEYLQAQRGAQLKAGLG
jgi:dGTPase